MKRDLDERLKNLDKEIQVLKRLKALDDEEEGTTPPLKENFFLNIAKSIPNMFFNFLVDDSRPKNVGETVVQKIKTNFANLISDEDDSVTLKVFNYDPPTYEICFYVPHILTVSDEVLQELKKIHSFVFEVSIIESDKIGMLKVKLVMSSLKQLHLDSLRKANLELIARQKNVGGKTEEVYARSLLSIVKLDTSTKPEIVNSVTMEDGVKYTKSVFRAVPPITDSQISDLKNVNRLIRSVKFSAVPFNPKVINMYLECTE